VDIIQAINHAIQEELKAAERYRNMAREAEDPETRLLLEQLAREEDMHFRKLNERLKAIRLMG
jgi:rubrerythrin